MILKQVEPKLSKDVAVKYTVTKTDHGNLLMAEVGVFRDRFVCFCRTGIITRTRSFDKIELSSFYESLMKVLAEEMLTSIRLTDDELAELLASA